MPYLVELVKKFPIDWHLNLKILILVRIQQKIVTLPLIKYVKICGKFKFFFISPKMKDIYLLTF